MKTIIPISCIALLAALGCKSGDSGAGKTSAASASAKAKVAPKPDKPKAEKAKAPAAKPKEKAKGPFPESTNPALKDPALAKDKAPAKFKVKFETTAGEVVAECHKDWAPHGADRLFNLAKIGFYNDVSIFRAVKGFVVQFGIHGNPEISKKWKTATLPVDPVKETNRRGTITYAMAGSPTTRTTQLFINLKDNKNLDGMGFAPVCEITEGMDNVDKLYMGYGGRPSNQQGTIQAKGNEFLRATYPKLDYIKTISVVDGK